MAARRLRPDERLLDLRPAEGVEGYEVHTRSADEALERRVLTDVPPAQFVDRWNGDHGEVRVAPLVDQMLARLRRTRAAEEDGTEEDGGPAEEPSPAPEAAGSREPGAA